MDCTYCKQFTVGLQTKTLLKTRVIKEKFHFFIDVFAAVLVCCFTGVYCGVVFTLIGFSILETILVNILIAKGEKAKSIAAKESRGSETGRDGKYISSI